MATINPLSPSEGPQRSERAQSRRPEASDQTGSEAAPSDRLELSEEAQQAQDRQDRLGQEARNLPEVREDRVAEARARLEAGDYDSEDVRRVIAERLLQQFGL